MLASDVVIRSVALCPTNTLCVGFTMSVVPVIHHIFPKKYLQRNGIDNRKDYNQIANYVYTQSEINIKIKDDAPCDYMARMKQQVSGEGSFYGGISSMEDLEANLAENCVPIEFMGMDVFDFQVFLDMRRTLMAKYIREYYEGLE